jgi:hypothetical protein
MQVTISLKTSVFIIKLQGVISEEYNSFSDNSENLWSHLQASELKD